MCGNIKKIVLIINNILLTYKVWKFIINTKWLTNYLFEQPDSG